jgi:Leucine-rich repeat (LRR) protein
MAVALLATTALFALPSLSLESSKTRVVVFPEHASIGRVYLISDPEPDTVADDRGKFLGQAKGKLTVPVDSKLVLELDPAVGENPALLTGTAPDALYSVRAKYCDCTDATLAQLCNLSSLARLEIIESEISDKGMQPLSKLKRLHRLNLMTSQVNGSGLKILQQLPQLFSLSLANNHLNQEALSNIGQMSNLQILSVAGDHLNDASIKDIGKLKKLKNLNICQNPDITGSGILALKNCTKLEKLELRNTGVRARDVLALKGLPLKMVTISENVLSKDLDRQLSEALPACSFVKINAPNADDKAMFAPLRR